MELIHPLFKWLHIIAGIVWIGLLYFFNWINGHFAATLDAGSKKKVVPELMPRALYWFRWGAAWTWVTGVILLLVVFYHGGLTFDDGDWSMNAYVMIAVTFLGVFLYDALYKTGLSGNVRVITVISFVLIGIVVYLMKEWAGFSYRSFNIHLGALLGTNMAFNVWYRIWPAQQQIISAIKNGDAPDGKLVALAGLRSKHNTYMSVPLLWTMINQHHAAGVLSGGNFGVTDGTNWVPLMVMVALGWHVVWQLYKKSSKVQGM
ncbi:MAG: urate hydroxylase PuuD [Candidatus Neomarinimicrobiota bacterium]|nr:urate hydroxylase PuuD [Candidatus Neomarinimicrobiota bacterium]|tara:strand:+ start:1797 stop:2579 length:783 start_codon:yes stop_codon:yes gene_type:complete